MVKLANLSNWGFYPLCFTYRLLFLEEGKWPFSPVVSGTWLRSSYQVTNGWEMFTTTMDSATKIRTECSPHISCYLRRVTLPAVIYLGFSAKRSNKGYYSAAGWTQWWGKLGERGPGAGLGEGNVCNDGCRQWRRWRKGRGVVVVTRRDMTWWHDINVTTTS